MSYNLLVVKDVKSVRIDSKYLCSICSKEIDVRLSIFFDKNPALPNIKIISLDELKKFVGHSLLKPADILKCLKDLPLETKNNDKCTCSSTHRRTKEDYYLIDEPIINHESKCFCRKYSFSKIFDTISWSCSRCFTLCCSSKCFIDHLRPIDYSIECDTHCTAEFGYETFMPDYTKTLMGGTWCPLCRTIVKTHQYSPEQSELKIKNLKKWLDDDIFNFDQEVFCKEYGIENVLCERCLNWKNNNEPEIFSSAIFSGVYTAGFSSSIYPTVLLFPDGSDFPKFYKLLTMEHFYFSISNNEKPMNVKKNGNKYLTMSKQLDYNNNLPKFGQYKYTVWNRALFNEISGPLFGSELSELFTNEVVSMHKIMLETSLINDLISIVYSYLPYSLWSIEYELRKIQNEVSELRPYVIQILNYLKSN